ncbi:extracellular calcium-sensing receptor-like [Erpetoichthys calabaricus]|uniref:extracellular calcium-sensing receptor-like n=1 Tax=Erpetoichthys calabaricus TaxID=27687 RepID=UPI002234C477|nr:extracellular calcium-sensing receptor-like [Erpetoichthys calabaricus]
MAFLRVNIIGFVIILIKGLTITFSEESKYKFLGNFHTDSLFEDGDFILGGLFPLHFRADPDLLPFDAKPKPSSCSEYSPRGFRWMQTMIFAIKEINARENFLPNFKIGYRMMDSCDHILTSLRSALVLLNGQDESVDNYTCVGDGHPATQAIIGDAGSSRSVAVLRTIGHFRIPLVSYFASCNCLSDKLEFPSFMRTIPSDAFQIKAIVRMVKHFRWTWVGAIGLDTDYARFGIQLFVEEAKRSGVCVAYAEFFPTTYKRERILEVVDIIKSSSAKVVLGFTGEGELIPILDEFKRQNITDIQWIASEAWATATLLWSEYRKLLIGTIGFAIRKGDIPGLKSFLTRIRLSEAYSLPFIAEFWEEIFNCKLNNSLNLHVHASTSRKPCSGHEDLITVENTYTDVTQLRVSYNVYKAVYAVAHALHNMNGCKTGQGPFANNSCGDIRNVLPWQLLRYMKEVNFTTFGQEVSFDKNGDPIASYDLVNWHEGPGGTVQFVKVGFYDAALEGERELFINDSIIFWHGGKQAPVSVCSNSCLPGSRKAPRKGQPSCCFDCIPCADGEISNQTDSIECFKCALEDWSNEARDRCLPKIIEFLSYEDTMGITLTFISIFGACVTIAVAIVFTIFRQTPIVRANNMELSFLLLLFLVLCFLCPLAFIGEPTNISCFVRHTLFGISFALCISCILGKTVVVLMAFRATLPGNNVMKWFGLAQQRASVFICTSIQIVICIIWLTTSPPYAIPNSKFHNSKIILECSVGSAFGFWCVLSYIGFLASMCFVIAFLARKLPDNFNEAKFITFSMLIFFAVWITFIPAYISTPGKYTVAVELFAILASAFGLLFCIFAPKCYIILFKPEKNTKKHMMGKGNVNSKKQRG